MNINRINKKNRPQRPFSKVFAEASRSRGPHGKGDMFKWPKAISLILLTIPLVFIISCTLDNSGEKKDNPYEYDITRFKKIDPALIKYKEIKQIKIHLETLHSLAVGPQDNIYITGDNTLIIMEESGQIISRIHLEEPAKSAAVGPDKRIYLGMIDHVEVYNNKGKRQSKWERLGDRARITAIAVTESDVFVADAGNRVVLRYGTSGNLIGRIGKKDPKGEIPGLIVPGPYLDVAIGYEGYLWVVNPGLHVVENYTFGGALRSSWGKASIGIDGFCGCCNPTHIAILANGSFVTSEKGIPRVKIHNQSGNLTAVVAGPEHFKEGTVGLDLAVDSTGSILVLDPSAGVVRIFKKVKS